MGITKIYFNNSGYYITGQIELIRLLNPRDGIDELLYLSMVCAASLAELRAYRVSDTTEVYNDSRIIEEINGVLEPTNPIVLNHIKYSICPEIPGILFFKKKSYSEIENKIRQAAKEMLPQNNFYLINKEPRLEFKRDPYIIENFKRRWINAGK